MASVSYRKVDVDGIGVFYREAGPKDAPTILLLHGFPTAGHMFRDLIPQLGDRFRLVAPDLPAFGQSDMPPRGAFTYTGQFSGNAFADFLLGYPKSAVSGTEWPRAHSETSTAMAPTATPRLTDTC